MGQYNQEYRLEYWATRSSVCLFARTAYSLSLLRPAGFARAFRCAHSLYSLPLSWDMVIYSVFFSILAHSARVFWLKNRRDLVHSAYKSLTSTDTATFLSYHSNVFHPGHQPQYHHVCTYTQTSLVASSISSFMIIIIIIIIFIKFLTASFSSVWMMTLCVFYFFSFPLFSFF